MGGKSAVKEPLPTRAVQEISKVAIVHAGEEKAKSITELGDEITRNNAKIAEAKERLEKDLRAGLTQLSKEVLEYQTGELTEMRERKSGSLSKEANMGLEEICDHDVRNFGKKIDSKESAIQGEIDDFNKAVMREIGAVRQKYSKKPADAAEAERMIAAEAAEIERLLQSIKKRQEALLERLEGVPGEVAGELEKWFDRLKEMQGYRIENATTGLIMDAKKAEEIEPDERYYLKDKADLGENMREMGAKFERLDNCYGKEFSDAYWFMADYFPLDELDPPAVLMEMMNAGKEDMVERKTDAPEMTADTYSRYYLVITRDRNGEVVAVADGNTIANEGMCNAFLAHIAVMKKHRRKDIATVLESAVIGVANQHAVEAEGMLGAPYKTSISGNRVSYMIVETEAANRIGMGEADLTFTRLMFHASNGFKVISGFRYAQVDLEWPADKPFDAREWNTVPLLLVVRKIGEESVESLPEADARAIGNQFEDYFHMGGIFNSDGVEFDRGHMFKTLEADAEGNVRMIPLPSNAGDFREFLQECPTMDVYLPENYGEHHYAREYMERFKAAEKEGRVLPAEYVIQMLERKTAPPTISSS